MEANNACFSVIERIFSNWTGLKLAVEHGMGSREQAHNFCQYVVELLSMNEQLHYSDVAAELEDYMDAEFSTNLEDDSEKQVAEDILRFYSYIRQNDVEKFNSELTKLPQTQPWIVSTTTSKAAAAVNDSDSDDNDEGDNSTLNENKMEVDSEGFTIVRRKKK